MSPADDNLTPAEKSKAEDFLKDTSNKAPFVVPNFEGNLPKLTEAEKSKIHEAEMAWETAVSDSPDELWRVVAMRILHRHAGTTEPGSQREIKHINWFATEERAQLHGDWINDGRGRVVSITKYRKVEGDV